MSWSSETLLIAQVVVNKHPAGVTVTVGRATLTEVSCKRLKVVVPPANGLSEIVETSDPQVSKKVT